ncbi:MAG: ABC transporter ATP-binding protein [Chloroflexi bacterium]|nr:ABC transporter ATP-binding protein [Chloroflexota bacterium]
MKLEINSIGKQYKGGFWGLQEFSLELGSGVLGLLGPNGAGKSTLMNILATVTKPTTGTAVWNNSDIVKQPNVLRAELGYLPQDFGVYPNLNAVEFLQYIAAIKGLDGKTSQRRIDELLQLVNLTSAGKRPLGGYSGGMRQRVGIAQALLNDPKLLIVDEPTVGLDPEERVRFRNLIADLSGERIIILSTHIVSDVEATATSIAIMNQGRLITHALPEDLLQAVEGKVWQFMVSSDQLTTVRQQYIISNTIRRRDGVQVRCVGAEPEGKTAVVVSPTLEDAYLYFINNNRGEAV